MHLTIQNSVGIRNSTDLLNCPEIKFCQFALQLLVVTGMKVKSTIQISIGKGKQEKNFQNNLIRPVYVVQLQICKANKQLAALHDWCLFIPAWHHFFHFSKNSFLL
jgi:hypothetical protein